MSDQTEQNQKKIILPGDPDVKQPIVMGDAYEGESLPPKLAQQKKIAEFDKSRNELAKTTGYVPYPNSTVAVAPDPWYPNLVKSSQSMGGVSNVMTNPMWFSPLHTPQNWQIASKRREVYQWCRFFYENEPKVAAAIDFYSQFPMNGFKFECPSHKIMEWFKHHVSERLHLNEMFKQISSEYFMIGDVFVHSEVDCPHCGGTAVDPDTGEQCNHPGGSFRKLIVMNPDWIEVQQTPIVDEPNIVFIPDEELKRIVFYRQPKNVYDKIPDNIKQLILQNKPIRLSNRTTNHLKHMPVPYGTYGTSLIRRLFTTLAYKTKILTANWIVAERLILPVRVVKIGSDNRPASTADIADVQQQLAATANDPNLTIVTHHNFEYEWYGASGKILQVTQEMEHIDKEILDGMMLNQSLLNGEMSGYQSAAVGVETLIRRIEAWRHKLAEWVEEKIFKPIAEMQGFIDKEKSEEIGETVYLYPRIKWNDLNLKDNTQFNQLLMQLHDKQVLSTQTLLEKLNLNYDQEVKRRRYEAVTVGPAGGMLGGGGGAMGGGGGLMGGGGGGGMPGGPEGMSPMMPGGAPLGGGGVGGGEMGGMGGGGMPGAGAMAGAAGKVMKKGKGDKQKEQEQQVMAVNVPLTRIEQQMASTLLKVAHNLGISGQNVRVQFPIQNPEGGKPFCLDFALPRLKLGIECDGEIWHNTQEQQMDDMHRDQLLAQRGWTILRFDDKVIDDAPQEVEATVTQFIQKALKTPKHAKGNPPGFVKLFSSIRSKFTDLAENYDEYTKVHQNVERDHP